MYNKNALKIVALFAFCVYFNSLKDGFDTFVSLS